MRAPGTTPTARKDADAGQRRGHRGLERHAQDLVEGGDEDQPAAQAQQTGQQPGHRAHACDQGHRVTCSRCRGPGLGFGRVVVVGPALLVGSAGHARRRGPDDDGGQHHQPVPVARHHVRQQGAGDGGHHPHRGGTDHHPPVDQVVAGIADRARHRPGEDGGQGGADGHEGRGPEEAHPGRRDHRPADPERAREDAGEHAEGDRQHVAQGTGDVHRRRRIRIRPRVRFATVESRPGGWAGAAG